MSRQLPLQEFHFVPRAGRGNRWEIGTGQVLFMVGTEVPFLTVPKARLEYPVGHPNLWVWVAVTWGYDGPQTWLPLSAEIGAGTSLPADAHATQYFPVARLLGQAVFPLTNYGPLVVSPPDDYGATVQVGYQPSPSGATKFALFLAGRHAQTDATPATGTSQIDGFRPDGTTAATLYFGHGQLYAVETTPSGGSTTGYPRQAGRYKEALLGPSGPVTLWFLNGLCVQADL